MGNIAVWKAQVEQWQQDEQVIDKSRTLVNPTLISIRRCVKCGVTGINIHRHHKGHEYLWARLLPAKSARRYIEFRPKDWVCLCVKHHLKIHRLYEPRLHTLWALLNRQNGRITFKQAEQYRLKLVRCCDNWIKKGSKNGR